MTNNLNDSRFLPATVAFDEFCPRTVNPVNTLSGVVRFALSSAEERQGILADRIVECVTTAVEGLLRDDPDESVPIFLSGQSKDIVDASRDRILAALSSFSADLRELFTGVVEEFERNDEYDYKPIVPLGEAVSDAIRSMIRCVGWEVLRHLRDTSLFDDANVELKPCNPAATEKQDFIHNTVEAMCESSYDEIALLADDIAIEIGEASVEVRKDFGDDFAAFAGRVREYFANLFGVVAEDQGEVDWDGGADSVSGSKPMIRLVADSASGSKPTIRLVADSVSGSKPTIRSVADLLPIEEGVGTPDLGEELSVSSFINHLMSRHFLELRDSGDFRTVLEAIISNLYTRCMTSDMNDDEFECELDHCMRGVMFAEKYHKNSERERPPSGGGGGGGRVADSCSEATRERRMVRITDRHGAVARPSQKS